MLHDVLLQLLEGQGRGGAAHMLAGAQPPSTPTRQRPHRSCTAALSRGMSGLNSVYAAAMPAALPTRRHSSPLADQARAP